MAMQEGADRGLVLVANKLGVVRYLGELGQCPRKHCLLGQGSNDPPFAR